MKVVLGNCLGVALVLAGIVVPPFIAWKQVDQKRNFAVVRPGVLYRSCQLSGPVLLRTLKELGIKTIVNLREGKRDDDLAEEALCRDHAIRFVRIAPLSWKGTQGDAEVDSGLATFLEVMADPRNHPVLVHCWRGIHRTGGYVAVYRMELEDWSKDLALAEMRRRGYVQFDEHVDVKGYLLSYRRTGRFGSLVSR